MNRARFNFADYLTSNLDFDFLYEIRLNPRYRPEEIAIIGHVHCLPSLTYLIKALANIGIPGNHIYLLAKPYSTIPAAVEALRALGVTVIDADVMFRPGFYDESANPLIEIGVDKVYQLIALRPRLRRLIIIDDGGLLTAAWWRRVGLSGLEVVSVQQTASGFGKRRRGRSPFVKIDVARSAAKRFFEAKIIVDGVLAKVLSYTARLRDSRRVAVVGMGALGSRLARMLVEMGKEVWVYDRARIEPIGGVNYAESWWNCIRYAEIVFGCTGANWLDVGQMVSPVAASVGFISCSSRDVEFKSLLQYWSVGRGHPEPRFAPLHVVAPSGAVCHVDNWGFPINFDRTVEWESDQDIALTRALIYGGVLQAMASDVGGQHERVEPLSAEVQRTLVDAWLGWKNSPPSAFGVAQSDFNDLAWWGSNSIPSDEVGD